MVKKIGNGIDTSLWYDNWPNNSSLLAMSGLQHPPAFSKNWTVSEILEDGEWSMKLTDLEFNP